MVHSSDDGIDDPVALCLIALSITFLSNCLSRLAFICSLEYAKTAHLPLFTLHSKL